MNDVGRDLRWRHLIEREQEAFRRARRIADTDNLQQRENHAREWFSALSEVLYAYTHSHIYLNEGGLLKPYPGDAVNKAAELFANAAAGQLSQPFHDINVGGGRPNRWPGMEADIAVAIHYVKFARAKQYKDPKFIATVAEVFRVDRTMVHGWLRKEDEICDGVALTPLEAFPDALRRAGARYHFNRTGKKTPGVE